MTELRDTRRVVLAEEAADLPTSGLDFETTPLSTKEKEAAPTLGFVEAPPRRSGKLESNTETGYTTQNLDLRAVRATLHGLESRVDAEAPTSDFSGEVAPTAHLPEYSSVVPTRKFVRARQPVAVMADAYGSLVRAGRKMRKRIERARSKPPEGPHDTSPMDFRSLNTDQIAVIKHQIARTLLAGEDYDFHPHTDSENQHLLDTWVREVKQSLGLPTETWWHRKRDEWGSRLARMRGFKEEFPFRVAPVIPKDVTPDSKTGSFATQEFEALPAHFWRSKMSTLPDLNPARMSPDDRRRWASVLQSILQGIVHENLSEHASSSVVWSPEIERELASRLSAWRELDTDLEEVHFAIRAAANSSQTDEALLEELRLREQALSETKRSLVAFAQEQLEVIKKDLPAESVTKKLP
jgi:hypothetical protein